MLRTVMFASLISFVGVAGCKKDAASSEAAAKAPAKVASTVGANGLRRVAIEAGTEGYVPDKIPGKPGEKMVLVFTRTADAECISQLKTPEGKLVDLPKGAPVEVNVTVPQTGALTFACGMDMFHGSIVADDKS